VSTGPAMVAGVDSSTQSCKIVVCELESGQIVRTGRAAYPDGTEVSAAAWLRASRKQLRTPGCWRMSRRWQSGGQQHGMVTLDESGELVRDALLWNDNRSAQDATDLIAELVGPEAWADAVGSVCRIHASVEDSLAGPLRAGQCRPDNRCGPSPRLTDLAHRRPVVRTRYRPR
jgi:xylulokinase